MEIEISKAISLLIGGVVDVFIIVWAFKMYKKSIEQVELLKDISKKLSGKNTEEKK